MDVLKQRGRVCQHRVYLPLPGARQRHEQSWKGVLSSLIPQRGSRQTVLLLNCVFLCIITCLLAGELIMPRKLVDTKQKHFSSPCLSDQRSNNGSCNLQGTSTSSTLYHLEEVEV